MLEPRENLFLKKLRYSLDSGRFSGKVSYMKQNECKVVVEDGIKQWFLNGERHREDGPAIEYADGDKSWYRNGKLHREDGPAIEYADGEKLWYVNGKCHREDGPAIEYADGDEGWYLNGEEVTEAEVMKNH